MIVSFYADHVGSKMFNERVECADHADILEWCQRLSARWGHLVLAVDADDPVEWIAWADSDGDSG
jgi:hypothetical protein